MLYDHVKDKIAPFIDDFQAELKYEKDKVGRQASAKGEINDPIYLLCWEKAFSIYLLNKLNELKDVIFNEIRSKKIETDFKEVKVILENATNPIIAEFEKDFEKEVKRIIKAEERISKFLNDVEHRLKKSLVQLFVDYEQEFNSIS